MKQSFSSYLDTVYDLLNILKVHGSLSAAEHKAVKLAWKNDIDVGVCVTLLMDAAKREESPIDLVKASIGHIIPEKETKTYGMYVEEFCKVASERDPNFEFDYDQFSNEVKNAIKFAFDCGIPAADADRIMYPHFLDAILSDTEAYSRSIADLNAHVNGRGKTFQHEVEIDLRTVGQPMFEELRRNVIKWASERNLLKPENSFKQLAKTMSELGELSDAMLKKDGPAIIDGLGDVLITLIILSEQLSINPVDALNSAYGEIKNRTGKTVDGTFIKITDL